MTSIVLDASAAVELLTRSTIGADLESKVTQWPPPGMLRTTTRACRVHGWVPPA